MSLELPTSLYSYHLTSNRSYCGGPAGLPAGLGSSAEVISLLWSEAESEQTWNRRGAALPETPACCPSRKHGPQHSLNQTFFFKVTHAHNLKSQPGLQGLYFERASSADPNVLPQR